MSIYSIVPHQSSAVRVGSAEQSRLPDGDLRQAFHLDKRESRSVPSPRSTRVSCQHRSGFRYRLPDTCGLWRRFGDSVFDRAVFDVARWRERPPLDPM